mmetsp:Transcript_32413/g.95520  ORF Transcript_32413/g.95520 Transcript_32413/m.95520 type:complete len:116 (-) Transcript_32413:345-692(-)
MLSTTLLRSLTNASTPCKLFPSRYRSVIEGLAAKATEKGTETTRECYEIAKSLQKDRKRKRGEDATKEDGAFDESMFEKDDGAADEMDCDDNSSQKKNTTSKKKKGKKKKARKVW